MSYPVLEQYLSRLTAAPADARISLDSAGRAQGRFFNCTLTSVFHPLRHITDWKIDAFEADTNTNSGDDIGLAVWRMLNGAASDHESVELDRLCRMIHVLNFFRQSAGSHGLLYLSVHDRLLAAVGSNHGAVFRRILDGLGLPHTRIALQLPAATVSQTWLHAYVAENYRRNGFKIATHANDLADATRLLEEVRPDVIKLDVNAIAAGARLSTFLARATDQKTGLIIKRIDSDAALKLLRDTLPVDQNLLVQGRAAGLPITALDTPVSAFTKTEVLIGSQD